MDLSEKLMNDVDSSEVKKESVDKNPRYIIGFKGFDKDFKCRGMQYEVGKIHHYDRNKPLKICSSGLHFCQNLKDVFSYYNTYNNHRFAIVKAKYYPGIQFNQSDKSVTDELEILEEISPDVIKEFKDGLNKKKELHPDEIFGLKEYRVLQEAYPDLILGGSSALYLHGFNVIREKKCGDLDITMDKYIRFDIDKFIPDAHVTEVDPMDNAKCSGNDFDYTSAIVIDGEFMILDCKINNKARYEIIKYKGFKYKVNPWNIIIEAKLRYAINGQTKHTKDFIDMFNIKPLAEEVEVDKVDKIDPIQELLNKYKI